MKNIGIFAGTFDPVHAGHIEFAKAAIGATDLDKVFFLPERSPHGKTPHASYKDRVVMLKLALESSSRIEVLELSDDKFTIANTLPKLQKKFAGRELVFLFGSDVAKRLVGWPDVDKLLSSADIVVGLRAGDKEKDVRNALFGLKARVTFIASPFAELSSVKIRGGKH